MIEVKNVVKTFDGFAALNDATLSVPTGAVYGLVGPNGAGKSTIIRHLTGIFRQNSGTVRLGGEDVWENAALKAKLKVLVEKVEDYRATEDSMRATLLTAQKMADSIVHEAEAKRDEILAQAETSAREKIGQLRQEVEAAEERLHQGQRDLAQFIAASREICEKELKFLEQLPELPVEAAEPVSQQEPEEAVQQIEEKVLAAFSEQSVEEEAAPAEAEEASPAAEDDYPEGDPFAADPVDEPTRRINLNDLKFGRNYSGGDD